VVRKPNLTAKQLTQVRNGADVGVFGAGGVGASALEQHQLGAASVAGGAHSVVESAEAGHTGGDDQGLAGGSSLRDQRQVVVLEAGDLVGGGAELFQEVNGGFIEWRTEADQAQLAGPLHDRPVPFPGGVGLLVEIMQVLAGPEGIGIADFKAAATHVERNRLGGVGLQLDRVGSGLGCRLHDRQGPLQALVVVAAHFGDHKRWMLCADNAAGDVDRHGAEGSETAEPGKEISMAVEPAASWPQG